MLPVCKRSFPTKITKEVYELFRFKIIIASKAIFNITIKNVTIE